MSRIGNLPISIPDKVTVASNNENTITVKGNFGELQETYPSSDLTVEIQDSKIIVQPKSKKSRALQGLFRTLINNMIIGVSERFEKVLEINGVGYRAQVKGKELTLSLGYSHPVKIEIPETVSVEVIQNTTINLKSCDKELLGLFAANIRAWRKPEPYKGKGVLYKDERIIRKAGKSAKLFFLVL